MNLELRDRAVAVFREKFGRDPDCLAIAPGRVNLIGEHTDYNGGHVFPMAVDRHVVIAAGKSGSARSRFWSTLDDEFAEFDVRKTADWKLPRWARYVAGAGAVLSWEGARIVPLEAVIVSDLPAGAGMSSSAALEVATALAFLQVSGQEGAFNPRQVAQICQKAEHKFTGVKCGIMDQFAVACCQRGKALYLDCNSLFAQQVPFPPEAAVLVADSKVARKLAEGEYNQRRDDCEDAARKFSQELGRRVQLAEVTREELNEYGGKLLDQRQLKRARHVISEELRTARAVEFLKRGQLEAFGELARESHRSLAEDFEVSCPELDILVKLACDLEGVYGARLTGAGFGGAAVVFCRSDRAAAVAQQLRDIYKVETGKDSMPMITTPAAGARTESFGG